MKLGFVRAAEKSAERMTRVMITDAGVQVLADAEEAWSRAHAEFSAAFGPEAASTLDRWLDGLDIGMQLVDQAHRRP